MNPDNPIWLLIALTIGGILTIIYFAIIWPIPDHFIVLHGIMGGIVFSAGAILVLYAIDIVSWSLR